MATGDHTWTKLAIGAAIAVKMGAVYVDIKQTQSFFEEGFEGNPLLVRFVFAMTDDGTAKRESTIAQNNFWIATYMTTVNVGMVSIIVLVVPTVKRATGYQFPLVSVAMALWLSAFSHLGVIDSNQFQTRRSSGVLTASAVLRQVNYQLTNFQWQTIGRWKRL